jgi:hypothetical protein
MAGLFGFELNGRNLFLERITYEGLGGRDF